jgi:hypothetical protein
MTEEVSQFLEEESAPAGDSKHCPMCGATIKAAARKCRYCGENLDGREWEAGVWRLGKQLVMRKDAKLPDRCVQTNRPAERKLTRRLYWHHPLLYVLIFFPGLLIYAIIALIVRHKAVIEVGLTQERFSRRRWTILFAWIGVLGGVGLIVTGFGSRNGDAGVFMALGGFILILASGVAGAILASIVRPAKITKEYVWLKGVHPDYLNDFPEFPGE